jgi:hypothetical protein
MQVLSPSNYLQIITFNSLVMIMKVKNERDDHSSFQIMTKNLMLL